MMSPWPSDYLVSLAEARILLQRAGHQEQGLAALVAAAETDVRRAEEALSDACSSSHASLNRLRSLLSTQLQRSQDGAEAVRQLCAEAHEQHTAVGVLLRRLNGELAPERGTGQRARPDAVLVVDDYGDVREVIAEVLRDAGFLVRTAANGLEGLLAAYEMRPRVIVMDVTMPVLDGLEATRLIKASDATRQARVIAYTSNPTAGDKRVEKLFAAVLQKPATPAALLATVQQVANL